MARAKTKTLTASQAALGSAMLALAGPIARRVSGSDRPKAWLAPLVAVLGLRQLAQAALVYAVDDPLFLKGGAAVDLTHAASMIPVAVVSSRYRAGALTSASLAVTSAVAGLAASG